VRGKPLVVAMCLLSVMFGLDNSMVNVCLPAIALNFGLSNRELGWLVVGNSTALIIASLVTGWASARIGRSRLVCVAIGGFVAAALAAAFSPDFPTLFAARAAQGVCLAPMSSLSLATLIDSYVGVERDASVRFWTAGSFVGPAAGPIIGGLMIDTASWRFGFLVEATLAAYALVLCINAMNFSSEKTTRDLDWIGLLIATVSIIAIQLGITQGNQLGGAGAGVALLLISGIAAAMFILRCKGQPNPLLSLSLFSDETFATAIALFFLLGMATFAFGFLTAIYLGQFLGMSGLEISAFVFPRNLTMILFALTAGPLLGAFSVWTRAGLAFGMILMSAVIMSFPGIDLSMLIIFAGALHGAGMGWMSVLLNAYCLQFLPTSQRDEGSSVRVIARNLGAAIGVPAVAFWVSGHGHAVTKDFPNGEWAFTAGFTTIVVISLFAIVVAVRSIQMGRRTIDADTK
jgi:MFS transporter, DHA2 family, multidrug resistance protein